MLIFVAGVCLVAQVLMRPAVGIANNNDFAKMAGALGLGPEDGDWVSKPDRQYGEFLYRYIRADRYDYNRFFQKAEYLSSEFFLVRLARGLQRIFDPGPRFDIRWLGGVNGAFFLLAIAVWIYGLPGRSRLLLGPLVILVWTDVAYVQYLNSFYMDTAAMISLVMTAGAALHVVRDREGWLFPWLTVFAAVLFTVSKSQHAFPGLLFIPLFLGLAWWSRHRAARAAWFAGPALLIVGALIVIGRNTENYQTVPVYNIVFLRIAPEARDPLRALQELGMGRDELPLLHTWAYVPQSPMQNQQWARQFHSRCNYVTLARYYLRHPSVPLHFLYHDLSEQASHILPVPFGNLSPDDGFKPYSRASHFGYWSDLRSFLLKYAPWHILLFAFCAIAAAIWLMSRSYRDRPLAGLTLTISAITSFEYALAILADAAETSRHLMIFHVATEIVILLFPILCWRIYTLRPHGDVPS
jgi:hypothetical protein